MTERRRRDRLGAALGAVLLLACSRTRGQPASERELRSSADASDASPMAISEDEDTVGSVYGLDASAADPLAVRLCAALDDLPQNRRAACCATTPGVLVTSECVRTLSAALSLYAVTLAAGDVDRCAGMMDRALAGCEWVGPHAPQPPTECQGIVRGALPDGSRCRSSLECLEGLRCHGVGPTQIGRCGAPRDEGAACGGAVDSLAVYARQNDYDARHPECKGWCNGRKCAGAVALGGPCSRSVQCGPGRACLAGTCASGPAAAPASRKRAGEPCTSDEECTGACLGPDAGGLGTCGTRCR